MTRPDSLVEYIFEPQPRSLDTGLSRDLLRWMEASTRFTAFVETYRDKIRKKVRVVREAESVLDVRAELEVAYALLGDRRFAVAYEPYASAQRRAADFAVTYRANLVFNVEVARLRVEEDAPDVSQKEERILRILLDKLGQMQPGIANLLLIHTRTDLANAIELAGLMQAIKARVEGNNPDFLAAIHCPNPAAFYKSFLHLGGILLASPGEAVNLWINKPARPGLDEKIQRQVAQALAALEAP